MIRTFFLEYSFFPVSKLPNTLSMAQQPKATSMSRLVFIGSQIGSLFIADALISSSYIQKYDYYPWRMNALLGCIGIRVLRQSFWGIVIAKDNPLVTSVGIGLTIGTINVILDSLSIYFTAKNNRKQITNMDYAALAIFGFGCILETGHDWLRSQFQSNLESKPENKKKFYKQGFAEFVVYPDYCGFWLWHTGRALLSHNIYFTASISTLQFAQFHHGAIPRSETYALNRYGQEYKDYSSKMYKMIPYIY